jgi:hypothetical protein
MYRAGLYFSDASRSSAAKALWGAASSRETSCRRLAQRRGDEPTAQQRLGTHSTVGRMDLRLSRDVSDLVRPAKANPRRTLVAKVVDAFRVTFDAKRRPWPVRPPPPPHPATHGLRSCAALARITESNRACPRRRASQAPFVATDARLAIAPCGPCADGATSAISGHRRIPRRATRQSPRSPEWQSPPPSETGGSPR